MQYDGSARFVSPRNQSVGRQLAMLAATVGVGEHAALLHPPIAVDPAVRIAVFGVGAAALFVALLCALGETDEAFPGAEVTALGRLRLAWRLGAQRAGLAALPLAALPLAGAYGDPMPLPAMLAGLSLVLLCISEARRSSGLPGRNSALPALPTPAGGRLGGWELCSLLSCLCVSGWFLVVASQVEGNNDHDAAYYYAIARHIVNTGRFEEPMVWHYLTMPPSVFHAPFDYWQPLTTLVLVPPMALFGATVPVAMTTMAVLSAFGLVLLWYIVTIAAPLRSRVAQAVALVLFAASPAVQTMRFDTESVPVFSVVLLGTLAAYASGRFVLAAGLAFLLYFTRGDGAVTCLLIWAACAFAIYRRQRRLLGREMGKFAFVATATVAAHIALSLWLHDSPTPPAAPRLIALPNHLLIYDWEGVVPPIDWWGRIDPPRVMDRFWVAWDNLRTISFLPYQALWMALILFAGWRSPRWRLTRLVWLLLFIGGGCVALAGGVAFASWRALYTMLPLVALVAATAVDYLLDRAARWPRRFAWPRAAFVVVSAGVLASLAAPLSALRPYGVRAHSLAPVERELRALSSQFGNGVVASVHPWSVVAMTDSPAIMIPMGNQAEIEAAFRRYGVSWLVLSPWPCVGEAGAVCAAIALGQQTSIGGLQLQRAEHAGHLAVFRVLDEPLVQPSARAAGEQRK